MSGPVDKQRRARELSVVVPVHRADHLDELLASLLGQGVDAEIVIVVDGALSDVLAVTEQWRTHDGIDVIELAESGGAGRARNIGLDACTGTYVAFADADDIVPAGAYRRLLDVLRSSGDDIASGAADQFREDGTELRYWTTDADLHSSERTNLTLALEPALVGDHTPWNKVFRRSFLDAGRVRFPEGTTSEDLGFWATAVASASVSVVPEVVYRHRRHKGSVTAGIMERTAVRDWGRQLDLASGLYAATGSSAVVHAFSERLLRREVWTRVRRLSELDQDTKAILASVVQAALMRAPATVTDTLGALRSWSYELLCAGETKSVEALLSMATGTCTRPGWDEWNESDAVGRVLDGDRQERTVAFWRETMFFPLLRDVESGDVSEPPTSTLAFLRAGEVGTCNEHEEQVLAALERGTTEAVAVMRQLRGVRATISIRRWFGLVWLAPVVLSGVPDPFRLSAAPEIVGARTLRSLPVRIVRADRTDLLRVSLLQAGRPVMSVRPRLIEHRGS